jgi:hypothetical protein
MFFRGLSLPFVLATCLCLSLETGAQVQVNTTSYLKAPGAAALEKFGKVPVSLYTGVPSISIPVYTIKTKDIEIPIRLDYHGGGIRVEEEASMVGLGWNLQLGNMITRTIHGKDDLYYGEHLSPSYLIPSMMDLVTLDYPQQLYYSSPIIATARRGTIDLTTYLNDQPELDFQPDEFAFSLPGHSGSFAIDRTGTAYMEAKDNTKITLIRNPADYLKTTWLITTGDGFRYYFDVADVLRTQDGLTHDYIPAWYLSKIESPGGDKVTYAYEMDNYSLMDNTSNFYEQREDARFNVSQTNIPDAQNYNCDDLFDEFQKLPKTDLKQQRLVSIDFMIGKLFFNYDTRIDKQGEKRLQSIELKDDLSTVVNTFTFIQDYFTENAASTVPPFLTASNLSSKRLKLVSFERGAAGEREAYSFDYDESALPAKYSFARDHWGFFNGAVNNNTLITAYDGPLNATAVDPDPLYTSYAGADRKPNAKYSQCFMLKRIIYPTGGQTNFEYEPNEYQIGKSGNNLQYEFKRGKLSYFRSAEGDQVKQTSFEVPEAIDADGYTRVNLFLNVLKDINDPAAAPIDHGYFKLVNAETGFIWENQRISDISDFKVEINNNMFVTMSKDYALPAGKYRIEIYVKKAIGWIRNIDLTYKYMITPEVYAKIRRRDLGGGLRIKRIIDYDEITRVPNERNFIYGQEKNGTWRSFGRLMAFPRYIDYIRTWGTIVASAGMLETTAPVDCRHFVRSGTSSFDLFSNGGVSVGYDTVIVVHGRDGTQGGITVSMFHNESDDVIDYGDSHPGGMSNFQDPMNGKLLREANLKFNPATTAFDTVSSKRYHYAAVVQRCMGMYSRSYAVLVQQTVLYGQAKRSKWENFFYPVMNSTWFKLMATRERSKEHGHVLEKSTTYTYSNGLNNYRPTSQKVDASDGTTLTTDYTYASDFINIVDDNKMLAATRLNFRDVPLEEVRHVNPGGRDIVTGGTLREYLYTETATAEPRLYPVATRALRIDNLLLRSNFQSLKQSNVIDSKYEVSEAYTINQADNTLIGQQTRDGIINSFIWGYKKQFPIAKGINCTAAEIFYSGFEDDGTLETTSAKAHWGRRFYDGDFTLDFPLPNTKPYQYSYWYRESGVWKFSGVLSYDGNELLSAGDAIDDVKVYPVTGKLSVYNFIPLKGMSSSTDENDITSYFEYTNAGKLLRTRDNNRNIRKEYQYKYQSK